MLPENELWFSNLAMASDGSLVAAAPCDANDDYQVKEIRLWEVPSAELARTIPISPDGYLNLAFSPDGDALAVSGTEGVLTFWDVAN